MSLPEEVLTKTGEELFKELLRIYPVADIEDYFDKLGNWKDETMRTDLQLVWVHRKEAGAPEPIPLEEVEMPPLPSAKPTTPLLAGTLKPVLPMGAAAAAASSRPTPLTSFAGSSPASTSSIAGSAVASAAGPLAELRLIALFVAKWKLDPTRTKLLLARLTPPRRRHVIQHFKTAAITGGEAAMKALQDYISTCERMNSWGVGPAASTSPGSTSVLANAMGRAPLVAGVRALPTHATRPNPALAARAPMTFAARAAAAAVAARAVPNPVAGVKRPLSAAMPQSYMPAATRPRIGGQITPTAAASAARLAGVRATAGITPRPVVAGSSPRAAWAGAAMAVNRANSWSAGSARPLVGNGATRAAMILGGRPNMGGGYRPMAASGFGGGLAGYRAVAMPKPGMMRPPW
eukprot:TRINITY_DN20005_c0_g1_i1.p1 TRINITY_DN20005_c0_g1~~TRINITY_DN20005_c0_g1_i1.p1  ORF type:complete len:406 (+),score=78.02 TRINITY_DN20005_c0_g1_i1:221-1438(+)